jgi:hypothetical protein
MKTKPETEINFNGNEYVLKSSIQKVPKFATAKNKKPLVMIRSYASGVHFGYLKSKKIVGDRYAVELENARRVYKWAGACSLSQLATEGTKDAENCKITIQIPLIEITEIIEIIPLTSEAELNLKGVKEWKS